MNKLKSGYHNAREKNGTPRGWTGGDPARCGDLKKGNSSERTEEKLVVFVVMPCVSLRQRRSGMAGGDGGTCGGKKNAYTVFRQCMLDVAMHRILTQGKYYIFHHLQTIKSVLLSSTIPPQLPPTPSHGPWGCVNQRGTSSAFTTHSRIKLRCIVLYY